MGLLKVFDDSERLGKDMGSVFQARYERLRMLGGISGGAMFSLNQVDWNGVVGEAFQPERDAHAEGGGTAEVGVQLHEYLRAAILFVTPVNGPYPRISSGKAACVLSVACQIKRGARGRPKTKVLLGDFRVSL